MQSNVELIGSGPETILRKVAGCRTNLVIDADYGERILKVADPSRFLVGMGVEIHDSTQNNAWAVSTGKIIDVVGDTLYIDNYLIRDYRADREGIVSNASSIIEAVDCENIKIKNFTIDGNKSSNYLINGCRGGGIYLHKVKNALVENIIVKNYNGDGISWQMTDNVTVRNCEVFGCRRGGLHPGSGSYHTVIDGNDIYNNDRDGLYICWRVQDGFVSNNNFHHNGRCGICTGHKDINMYFEHNEIFNNVKHGVHFREERDSNAPHGNTFMHNIIRDNGTKEGGYGFYFDSPAKDIILEENTITNSSKGKQKAAIFISANALPVILRNNNCNGHKDGDLVSERSTK